MDSDSMIEHIRKREDKSPLIIHYINNEDKNQKKKGKNFSLCLRREEDEFDNTYHYSSICNKYSLKLYSYFMLRNTISKRL